MKILITDPQQLFRQLLSRVFALEFPQAEIRDAATVHSAMHIIDQAGEPNLLVMETVFPDSRSGVELLEYMRRQHRRTRILVLTAAPAPVWLSRCMDRGASGFIGKDAAMAEVLYAADTVAKGREFVTPEGAELLALARGRALQPVPHERLSLRELEVMLHIAQGKTLSQVAAALNLSPKTISSHRASIMDKLGIDNNHALIRYALDHRLCA